jgi:hypothetical protein
VSTGKFHINKEIIKLAKKPVRRALLTAQHVVQHTPKTFCLITGSPRSGTTAVANWLFNHMRVKGDAESRILIAAYRFIEQIRRFNYLESQTPLLLELTRSLIYDFYANTRVLFATSVLLDKEPLEPIALPDESYSQFIDCMHELFPNLRIVFMLREPISAIWSMKCRKWGYSLTDREPEEFPLEQHIRTWILCAELIEVQRKRSNVYVCQYEKLVANPVLESERLCEFLGLKQIFAFEPRESKRVDFSQADLARINEATRDVWTRLTT